MVTIINVKIINMSYSTKKLLYNNKNFFSTNFRMLDVNFICNFASIDI